MAVAVLDGQSRDSLTGKFGYRGQSLVGPPGTEMLTGTDRAYRVRPQHFRSTSWGGRCSRSAADSRASFGGGQTMSACSRGWAQEVVGDGVTETVSQGEHPCRASGCLLRYRRPTASSADHDSAHD
jgi:hypothetical protein